ncbi:MAG: Ig-like domain-containing protein [Bacteroidales bacterium]|nr:Ig-like domain-containing protein [Bacteroidales bacterium]
MVLKSIFQLLQTRYLSVSLFLLLISVLMFQCANPVTPEGGAKDMSPPEVVECDPPNYSIHFSSPDIHITFNEFVSLKSTSTEIFTSPPLAKKPDYKLRGKTMIVDFKNTLDSNTTYIITFGKSISDITEGNVLNDFQYVFSTGDYIDSLSLAGQVIDAFDNTPVSEVYAELYINNNDTIPFDSLPYLVPPFYITQSNEQGMFTFHNLRDGEYKLFILADQSGEFIYNMPAEKIAFCDSLITPWFIPATVPDSTVKDSIAIESEIAAIAPDHALIKLKLFEEVDSTQEILKSELLMNDLFRVVYKYPPLSPSIIPLNLDSVQQWCMEEFSFRKDTVLLFPTIDLPDTLILEIRDGESVLDTAIISPTQLAEEKRSKKKDEKEKPERLRITWTPKGTFNYLKSPLQGQLTFPVSEYDLSGILLIHDGDTVVPVIEFTDLLFRKFTVTSTWKETTSYKLFIPDSVFISYNELTNDTTIHTFRTITLRELGSLAINIDMSAKPGNYIIQLLAEKGKVVEEKYLSESGQVKFAFIAPATYTIKAILDSNQNKRWDTGDYLNKIQPETVLLFPKNLEIRGNWDVEEEWKF